MSRIICIFTLVFVVSVQSKFPNEQKPCKYGDGTCLTNIINYYLSGKADVGDSSINLVKIDPLHVAKVNINQGAESPVNIDLTFTDNDMLGMKTMKASSVKGFGENPETKHELNFHADYITLTGPYTIKGKILILPIAGTGISNMTIVNCGMKAIFNGKTYEKNGETYMKASNFKILVTPERLYYHFSNLFNGDKALGDNMNIFLNENWSSIYSEVQESVQNAFAQIFEAIVTNVFSKYPYAKFFEH